MLNPTKSLAILCAFGIGLLCAAPAYAIDLSKIVKAISTESSNAQWRKYNTPAKDIGIGADGTVWIIGNAPENGGYGIFKLASNTAETWHKISGAAVRIDVDPNGNAWIISSDHNIYRWTGHKWRRMPGKAQDIGIGADGTVCVIGTTPQNGGFPIFKWTGKKWRKISGSAARIDVDPNGNPWIVSSDHNIYQRDNNKWVKIAGGATDIGIGGDGSVWVLGTTKTDHGYPLFKRDGSDWDSVSGHGTQISVDPKGRPWVVNTSDTLLAKKN